MSSRSIPKNHLPPWWGSLDCNPSSNCLNGTNNKKLIRSSDHQWHDAVPGHFESPAEPPRVERPGGMEDQLSKGQGSEFGLHCTRKTTTQQMKPAWNQTKHLASTAPTDNMQTCVKSNPAWKQRCSNPPLTSPPWAPGMPRLGISDDRFWWLQFGGYPGDMDLGLQTRPNAHKVCKHQQGLKEPADQQLVLEPPDSQQNQSCHITLSLSFFQIVYCIWCRLWILRCKRKGSSAWSQHRYMLYHVELNLKSLCKYCQSLDKKEKFPGRWINLTAGCMPKPNNHRSNKLNTFCSIALPSMYPFAYDQLQGAWTTNPHVLKEGILKGIQSMPHVPNFYWLKNTYHKIRKLHIMNHIT